LTAPWIHFEAGAVSKQLDVAKVTALLIGVEPGTLSGPLVLFQHTSTTRTDIKRLIVDLNAELGEARLPEGSLTQIFEAFWPKLETDLAQAIKVSAQAVPAKRQPDEVLAEVLDVGRTTSRDIGKLYESQERLSAAVNALASAIPGGLMPPFGYSQLLNNVSIPLSSLMSTQPVQYVLSEHARPQKPKSDKAPTENATTEGSPTGRPTRKPSGGGE
jgi:hypothetical protein